MDNQILENLPESTFNFSIIKEKKQDLIARKYFEQLMNLPEDLFEYNEKKEIVLDNYKNELIDYYNKLVNEANLDN